MKSNCTAIEGPVRRLVRQGSDRWFWTHDKNAEEWMGPFKTIDDAIADAEIYRSADWYPGTLTGPIYVGLGKRTTKAEREVWGVDFTHQINSDYALQILLPNVQCDATALSGGFAGWLSDEWKVGIHDLFC